MKTRCTFWALARPTTASPVRRNQVRVAVRNRIAPTRRPIDTTTTAPPATSPRTSPVFLTTNRPRTTRVVRKRITSTTLATTRKPLPTTTATTPAPTTTTTFLKTTPTTTTTTTTVLPEQSFSNELDEDLSSILPALTSVKPRKSQAVSHFDASTHRALQAISVTPIIETSSTKVIPTTTFDKILEHQYKIKGLDMDFEEEEEHQQPEKTEEDEKLIGVLGSQVKVVLHSVNSDPLKTKIECLENGNYPHPLSCNMYISCARNRGFIDGYIFSCGDEMSFDPIRGVCDWNHKIGCTRNNVKILHS